MALTIGDRVQETTTTTGTGTITLAGAKTGYQAASSVLSNADTTYYAIQHQTADEWEVGLGTYTSSGTTLARTTVISSSNSNNAVDFAAGTKDVFITMPASKMVYLDASGNPVGLAPAHVIQEEGSNLTARTKLNFVGTAVTAADDSGNDATKITIAASNASLPVTRSDGSTSDPIALTSAALGESLVSDTTPQLGGNLDVNGQSIVSDGSNENIPITPHGTGSVVISKADINAGAIDGTAIGASSASTGAFTTLAASGTTTLSGDQHITAGKALVVGGTTQYAAEAIVTPEVQVLGANRASASMLLAQYTADDFGPSLYFMKSRNASIGGNTVVQDGDQMGSLLFYANDGTDGHNLGAAIRANIDGTPGSNDTPGRLAFFTSADGSNALVERMRIGADGNVKVSDGDLVIGTSGHGIDFSAHAHASGMTSELLDDYEEGTFTPDCQYDNTSYTNASSSYGTYVKIGQMVYFNIQSEISNPTIQGGEKVYWRGLPFTSHAGNSGANQYEYSTHDCRINVFDVDNAYPSPWIGPNNDYVTGWKSYDNGTTWNYIFSNDIYRSSGSNSVVITGSYRVP